MAARHYCDDNVVVVVVVVKSVYHHEKLAGLSGNRQTAYINPASQIYINSSHACIHTYIHNTKPMPWRNKNDSPDSFLAGKEQAFVITIIYLKLSGGICLFFLNFFLHSNT